MQRFFYLLFAILISTSVADAKQQLYDCTIKVNRANSWIPEVLVIAHDLDSGDILISDPIIYYFNDERPSPGKIATDNNKRITYKWRLTSSTDRAGQFAKIDYRATYLKASKKMIVTGKPLGYTNNYRGDGTCKIVTK